MLNNFTVKPYVTLKRGWTKNNVSEKLQGWMEGGGEAPLSEIQEIFS